MDYACQVNIKKSQVAEILMPFAENSADIPFRPCLDIWHYRNKIELNVIGAGPDVYFAYNAPANRDSFIKTGECFLASQEINRLLSYLIKIIS